MAMCELLVGLPEVTVLDVTDIGDRPRVTVETERNDRRVRGVKRRWWSRTGSWLS